MSKAQGVYGMTNFNMIDISEYVSDEPIIRPQEVENKQPEITP